MHNSAQEALTQKVQVWNIRKCSRKTSKDGQAKSEHGLLKHQKNLRSEAEALKFSWYHARSTSRLEDKKMLCTKIFDSDIFKRQKLLKATSVKAGKARLEVVDKIVKH